MSAARRCVSAVLLLIMLASIFGCGARAVAAEIICEAGEYQAYADVVSEILPEFSVSRQNLGALSGLGKGLAVEAFDTLAVQALETGAECYWYPQYLAASVIAVDRDRTDADIRGWRDLLLAGASVGMAEGDAQIHMAAMSYGLEGEEYTPSGATELLSALRDAGRLAYGLEAPILICFDYQAAAMHELGRRMEIIVPEEGTFVFEKGLLSPQPLEFSGDAGAAVFSAGLRPVDGVSPEGYPAREAYSTAARPEPGRFNSAVAGATRMLRREVFQARRYSTADGREHYLMALAFILLVIMWTAQVIRRVMQKKVRRAAVFTSICIVGWVLLRALKWQLPFGTLSRYCWYGYYVFQLGIVLALLWLAWVSDKSEELLPSPKWWRVCVAVNGVLLLLVFTNDLHMMAFDMDLSLANAETDYTYGPVYYMTLAVVFAEAFAAFAMLLRKSWKSPRRVGFFLPAGLCVLLGLYCVGYILRVPPVVESDMAITVCAVTLIFIEACVRVGLIPVNTGYEKLFAASKLGMQIVNHAGEAALSSTHAEPLTPELWARISAGEAPLLLDDDTLVRSDPVTGGAAVWREDISRINQLRREIEESISKLRATNAMLEAEEQVKSKLVFIEARTALFSELEAEIEVKTVRLSQWIGELADSGDGELQVARITLLLCYIKRHCSLFFRRREAESMPSDEFVIFMEELVEFAAFAGVKLHIAAKLRCDITAGQAALFYEFLYTALEWAARENCRTLLAALSDGDGSVSMSLLPEVRMAGFCPDGGFLAALPAEGGEMSYKDLDETEGITLAFPERRAS